MQYFACACVSVCVIFLGKGHISLLMIVKVSWPWEGDALCHLFFITQKLPHCTRLTDAKQMSWLLSSSCVIVTVECIAFRYLNLKYLKLQWHCILIRLLWRLRFWELFPNLFCSLVLIFCKISYTLIFLKHVSHRWINWTKLALSPKQSCYFNYLTFLLLKV